MQQEDKLATVSVVEQLKSAGTALLEPGQSGPISIFTD
jgi:hypothetical protein